MRTGVRANTATPVDITETNTHTPTHMRTGVRANTTTPVDIIETNTRILL